MILVQAPCVTLSPRFRTLGYCVYVTQRAVPISGVLRESTVGKVSQRELQHCWTGAHRQAHHQHTTELPTIPTPAPRRELRTSGEFLEEHTVASYTCLSVLFSQSQELAYI